VIVVAVITGWCADVILFQKGDPVHAGRVGLVLIDGDAIRLHPDGITVACCTCAGEVCRVDAGFYVVGGTDIMAAVATGTFCDFGVSAGIPLSVNARTVLCKLINGKRRIVIPHEPRIAVTAGASGGHVQRVNRRGLVLYTDDPVGIVARRTLNQAFLSGKGLTPVHAFLQECALRGGKGGTKGLHPVRIGMTLLASRGDGISFGNADESGLQIHSGLHVFTTRIPAMTPGAGDSFGPVNVPHEKPGRFIFEGLVTGEALIDAILRGKHRRQGEQE